MNSPRKKILIFSLAYHPYVGGAEVAVKEITDRNQDIEFHMITTRNDSALPKEEKIGNILVHRIGLAKKSPTSADLVQFPLSLNKPLFQFYAVWKALWLHRAHRYSAVWGIMAHSAGVPSALFKTFVPSVPFILTLQEGDPIEHIEKTMRPVWPLFVRAFTKADVVQSISTFLVSWAKRRGAKNTVIIPNGVDVDKFSTVPNVDTLEVCRQKLGKKEGNIFLITTSRLVHKNGVDTVIEALALLAPEVKDNVHFAIFGTGTEEAKLKALAKERGVSESVHFFGHVEQSTLPALLYASDIFIRPSRSEGMGNSFIEAMATGIPVIATQEGGIADFLFDAERNPDKESTGFAVDKNSPKQIKEKIEYILSHQEEVARTVATAKKMVSEKYDWNTVARDMNEKVFAQVLKEE